MTIAYFPKKTFPSPMATFSQGKGLRVLSCIGKERCAESAGASGGGSGGVMGPRRPGGAMAGFRGHAAARGSGSSCPGAL